MRDRANLVPRSYSLVIISQAILIRVTEDDMSNELREAMSKLIAIGFWLAQIAFAFFVGFVVGGC